MPVGDGAAAVPRRADRRLVASRRNEQLKLAAASFDRLSTVVVTGALFAPVFQDQPIELQRALAWGATAVGLHGAAQLMLLLLREET